MAMKYRTLKESYKKSVGVFRSHIHGRGLFCTRDIEAGELIKIEFSLINDFNDCFVLR